MEPPAPPPEWAAALLAKGEAPVRPDYIWKRPVVVAAAPAADEAGDAAAGSKRSAPAEDDVGGSAGGGGGGGDRYHSKKSRTQAKKDFKAHRVSAASMCNDFLKGGQEGGAGPCFPPDTELYWQKASSGEAGHPLVHFSTHCSTALCMRTLAPLYIRICWQLTA